MKRYIAQSYKWGERKYVAFCHTEKTQKNLAWGGISSQINWLFWKIWDKSWFVSTISNTGHDKCMTLWLLNLLLSVLYTLKSSQSLIQWEFRSSAIRSLHPFFKSQVSRWWFQWRLQQNEGDRFNLGSQSHNWGQGYSPLVGSSATGQLAVKLGVLFLIRWHHPEVISSHWGHQEARHTGFSTLWRKIYHRDLPKYQSINPIQELMTSS